MPPQGRRDGRDDLGDQPVEVGVGGPADLQVVLTKVIDCLQGYSWLVFSSM